ncbi:MAG: histidine kinase [Bacteroidales bacterium]|nr:histidine kinase [Bacteroidales bacterium]
MKKKTVLYRILLVLGISLVSWLLYYAVWILIDEDIRMDFSKGWPFQPLELFLDYAMFCLFSFMATFYYLRSYDRAERERDRYKLLALENQINPHFVFNNFSTLAELIEVDPQKASKYLMNLSNVYRYALSHLEHDKVSLQDELTYLRQYLQLLGERFGDTICVNITPEVADGQGSVPPAVLQMIVENAIKHNEHTAAHPLNIDIFSDGQNITVRNNKRLVPVPESTQIGIHNIEERYRLLTRKKVKIEDGDDTYSITIPVIIND